MIAVASQKANKHGLQKKVKFEVVNVQSGLVYEKHEFDVIICLGLLETLPEAAKLLKDFTRVLKSNGVIVLSLYRGWAAASVALSYDWYEEHLTALGFREMGVFPCRRNQDVVIAHR
jgi:2-polyprenyl-3-methyl-5-hydroxy-6-metoxy-1,4-benzoquinol methylase